MGNPLWQTAIPVKIEQTSADGSPRPEMATTARALWSEKYLYLAYECPFTKLTVFTVAQPSGKRFDLTREGVSLWDRDVVEAFIGSDWENPRRYAEFEVAPTNERLDLMITNLPEKDFSWNSKFQSLVKVNQTARAWTCEMRLPLETLSKAQPSPGTQWHLNLFRCDRANKAFLAFCPTLTESFHVPERFGILEFVE